MAENEGAPGLREVLVAVNAVFEANGDWVLDTPLGQFRLPKAKAAVKPVKGGVVRLVFDRPYTDPARQLVEVAPIEVAPSRVPTTEGRRGRKPRQPLQPPPPSSPPPAE